MTDSDYQSAPWGLGQMAYQTDFTELYGAALPNRSLNTVGCVDANRYLLGEFPDTAARHRETVMAVHSSSAGDYAWDDVAVLQTSYMHALRRIYNFVFGIVMSGRTSFCELRNRLYYVKVMGVDASVHDMTRSLSALVEEPWEYDLSEYRGPHARKPPEEYKLSGVICKKAYRLAVDEIDLFVSKKGWK